LSSSFRDIIRRPCSFTMTSTTCLIFRWKSHASHAWESTKQTINIVNE
jgi:hypothetical protein